jgi:Fe2+ transport system protein B
MFDLEQSIADWRRQMLAAGIRTPVPLEELESHLRDEIERQTESGLSEREAFQSAVQKIGSAHTVQNEFQKVEAIEEERRWKEGQIWLGAILGLLQLVVVGAVLFNSDMTFGQRMSGLTAMATSFLLVAVGRLSCRIIPVIHARRTRTAIVFVLGIVPGIIWFWIFARFLLPGNDFGQYLATLLWVSCPPLGAFLGLIWGVETAARKGIVTAGS